MLPWELQGLTPRAREIAPRPKYNSTTEKVLTTVRGYMIAFILGEYTICYLGMSMA